MFYGFLIIFTSMYNWRASGALSCNDDQLGLGLRVMSCFHLVDSMPAKTRRVSPPPVAITLSRRLALVSAPLFECLAYAPQLGAQLRELSELIARLVRVRARRCDFILFVFVRLACGGFCPPAVLRVAKL